MPPSKLRRICPPKDRSAQDIRALVSDAVPPHASITSVQLLPHHSSQQVYEVKLSDASTMLVALPPLPLVKLMRTENHMAASEAVIIHWVRAELLERASRLAKHSTPSSPPPTSLPSLRATLLPAPRLSASRSPSPSPSVSSTGTVTPVAQPSQKEAASKTAINSMHLGYTGQQFGMTPAVNTDLLKYIPVPISLASPPPSPTADYNNAKNYHMPPPLTFNVFRPTSGSPISTLASPLSPAERMAVDFQAGKLLRQLSHLAPKSGHFGPALNVLSPETLLGEGHDNESLLNMGSWHLAFHAILESILRDAEDVAVQLPYPTVRKHFRRLGHLLDTVKTPSLVVVDAMDDTNLLVERLPALTLSVESDTPDPEAPVTRPTEKQRSASPTSPAPESQASPNVTPTESAEVAERSPSPAAPSRSRESRSVSSPLFDEGSSDIVVTGFRDWSHCIFGDPLFASVFCNQASAPFLSGFYSNEGDNAHTIRDGDKNEAILSYLNRNATNDDIEHTATRLLLYQCYHAIVQIVRGFYHPNRDRTTQELAARRRLTEILMKLEAVELDPRKRFHHRRPSGEMSPAKKPRSECGDEAPRR